MLNLGSEKKLIRGSCFVTPSSTTMSRQKPKKNIFTYPSMDDDSYDFNVHIQHDKKAGDSNESMFKAETNLFTNNNLEVKKAKTLVVDKKNLKYGHFSKLKKKNQEQFNKFLNQGSKDQVIYQMRTSIEKIQAKIDELSTAIECNINQQLPEKVVDVQKKRKPKIKEVFKAIAVVGIWLTMILLGIYFIEGPHFFNSVWSSGSLKQSPKTVKPEYWLKIFKS